MVERRLRILLLRLQTTLFWVVVLHVCGGFQVVGASLSLWTTTLLQHVGLGVLPKEPEKFRYWFTVGLDPLCLTYSRLVCSNTSDGWDQIQIWEVDYRKADSISVKERAGFCNPPSSTVTALCELRDGSRLLCGLIHGAIDIWRFDGGFSKRIKAHYRTVLSIVELAGDEEGKSIVATASRDDKIRVWNIDNYFGLKELTAGYVLLMAKVTSDTLLSTCSDNIKVWNWRTGKELYQKAYEKIQSCVVMRDSTILMTRAGGDQDEQGAVTLEFRRLWHRYLVDYHIPLRI